MCRVSPRSLVIFEWQKGSHHSTNFDQSFRDLFTHSNEGNHVLWLLEIPFHYVKCAEY